MLAIGEVLKQYLAIEESINSTVGVKGMGEVMGASTVVIGGGVVGSAVSWFLSSGGADVTVLDSVRPGGGTSTASGAWFNSNGKHPDEYHRLNVLGMRAHAELADGWHGPVWYHRSGNVEWADDVQRAARLSEKVSALRSLDYNVREISESELQMLEPDLDLASCPERRIAYYPDDGWLDGPVLVGALLSAVKSRGGRVIRRAKVTELEVTGNRITRVGFDDTSIAPDFVINCAGPAADQVAALAGATVPLKNKAGLCAYTAPAAVSIRRMVHSPDVNLRPDGGGRVWLHSMAADEAVYTNDDGSTDYHQAAVEKMLADARCVYPGLEDVPVETARVGVRPVPIDGLPAVGFDDSVTNLYTVVTHSGMTLCIALGRLAASEILGGTTNGEMLEPFRPTRFGTR